MNISLIIWSSVSGLLLLLIIANLIHAFLQSKHRILRMGSEREEFFVPGDPMRDSDLDEDI
ncbi:MAG: hypothetical protein K2L96_04175 [Muribaculaceae bacterium]|nr:hypothetical protein [Muribaculaceae bacterium]